MTDLNPYEEGLALELKAAQERIEALVKERDAADHLARMRRAFIEEARDERDAAEARAEAAEAKVKERDREAKAHEKEIYVWSENYAGLERKLSAAEAEVEKLRGALSKLHHAVCGETGFAACVRLDSGKAYPWPALDDADETARAALKGADHPPAPSRYMGQIMAECDCPREAECQAAGRCIAEGLTQ